MRLQILCSLALSAFVSCNDGKESRKFQPVSLALNKRTAVLETRSNVTHDAMVFSFSVNGFPNYRVKYRQNQDDAAIKYQYRIGIFKLVEFNDTIGVGDSNSTCSFLGKGNQWSDITVTEVSSLTNDTSASVKRVSSTFYGQGACDGLNMTLDAYVPNKPVLFNQSFALTPAAIKYSVNINNYTYQYENSSLAIVKGVFSSGAVVLKNSSDLVDLQDVSFMWKNTCETNLSQNATITNSDLENDDSSMASNGDDGDKADGETAKLIVFKAMAVHPSFIRWDPQLQLESTTAGQSNSGEPAIPPPPTKWIIFISAAVAIFFAL